MPDSRPRPLPDQEPGDDPRPQAGCDPDLDETPAPPTTPAEAIRRDLKALPELNGNFLNGYNDSAPVPGPDGLEIEEAEWYVQKRRRDPDAPLTLQSCGASATAGLELASAQLELILDENNLLPFHFLRTGDLVGQAVVKVLRGDGASGTGFLVAPDILLTNNHVLPDPETAATATVEANYECGTAGTGASGPTIVPLRPAEIFVTNAELDFTFVGVRGLQHLGVIPLHRTSLDVMRSEYVNIIQHPRGRPKEVALQDNQVTKVDHVVLQYTCDTEPGSSGSPVFNNRWKLVALHHASVIADESEGGRRASTADSRYRYVNEGIRLSAIALWLETAEAHTPEVRDQAARLRRIFEGIDPQAGFFGALGRSVANRRAAQFVVECYRGGGNTLDLAAWDLSAAGRPARNRLDDLGWVMAELGMDAWCLAGMGADDARVLCEHLDSFYKLDYRVTMAGLPGAAPIALLTLRSAGVVIEPAADHDGPDLVATLELHDRKLGLQVRPLEPDRPWSEAILEGPASPWRDAVLIGLGHPVCPEDLDAMRDAGLAPRAAASGPDGGLVALAGRVTRVESLFLSTNLRPHHEIAHDLFVTADRSLPPLARALTGHDPIALRLVFGPPRPYPGALPVDVEADPTQPLVDRPFELPAAPSPDATPGLIVQSSTPPDRDNLDRISVLATDPTTPRESRSPASQQSGSAPKSKPNGPGPDPKSSPDLRGKTPPKPKGGPSASNSKGQPKSRPKPKSRPATRLDPPPPREPDPAPPPAKSPADLKRSLYDLLTPILARLLSDARREPPRED